MHDRRPKAGLEPQGRDAGASRAEEHSDEALEATPRRVERYEKGEAIFCLKVGHADERLPAIPASRAQA